METNIESNKLILELQFRNAQNFPRPSESDIINKLVTDINNENSDAFEKIQYSVPRREKDPATGGWVDKVITGPSSFCAKLIWTEYKNMIVHSYISAETNKYIEATTVAIDLENNISRSVTYPQSITYKDGNTFNSELIQLMKLSAIAKSSRNAVLEIIPRNITDAVIEAANIRISSLRKPKNTTESQMNLDLFIRTFNKFCKLHSLDKELVLTKLGIISESDLTADHYSQMVRFNTAITEGATVDDILNPKTSPEQGGKAAASFGLSEPPPQIQTTK